MIISATQNEVKSAIVVHKYRSGSVECLYPEDYNGNIVQDVIDDMLGMGYSQIQSHFGTVSFQKKKAHCTTTWEFTVGSAD